MAVERTEEDEESSFNLGLVFVGLVLTAVGVGAYTNSISAAVAAVGILVTLGGIISEAAIDIVKAVKSS